jgi:hypothetical protein
MIRITFEKTLNGYTLRDALVLPDDHNLTEEELEAMKQQRFDNWYAIITAPPVEDPPADVPSDIIDVPPTDITPVETPIVDPVPEDVPPTDITPV